MLQCAFIGILDAVPGLRAFVFVTAVDFTCTSLVHYHTAIYVIVEMEEVRMQSKQDMQADSLGKTVNNKDLTGILDIKIVFKFKCVRRCGEAQGKATCNLQPYLFISAASYSTTSIPSTTVISPTPGIIILLSIRASSLTMITDK